MVATFLPGEPDIKIIDGIAYFTGEGLNICMPVARMRSIAHRAIRLLNEWDEQQTGKIVPCVGCQKLPPGAH